MKARVVVFGLVMSMILTFGLIYQFMGFRYFLKALRVINVIPLDNDRQQVWDEFRGAGQGDGVFGGIYAGIGLGRIWMWGEHGLKAFNTDEYSVYSWYDGCNDRVKQLLNEGKPGWVIQREVFTDINSWKEKIKVGDYLRIYLTKPGSGGTIGNLREIYTYNFWLFMRAGAEEKCAR